MNSLMLIVFSIMGYIPGIPAACAFQHNTDVVDQLTNALPCGIWETKQTQEEQIALHFYDTGEVDWFTFSSSELTKLENFTWEVQAYFDIPILYLSNHEKTLSFELSGDCYYLLLDERDGSTSLQLNHKATSPKNTQKAKLNQLQGSWENNSHAIAVDNPEVEKSSIGYLKYRFMPSGQFEKRLSNASYSSKRTGQWRLAKDGKHLIIRMEDGSVVVAMLKYLNMDELVLSHVYEFGRASSIGIQDVFFNRN
jgi:hypothetical protein